MPLDATRGYFADAEAKPYIGFGDAGTRRCGCGWTGAAIGSGRQWAACWRGARNSGRFGVAPEETPRDYLFYSGGGGTVRGQPFQSLGVSSRAVAARARLRSGSAGRPSSACQLRGAGLKVTDTIGLVGLCRLRANVGAAISLTIWATGTPGAGLGLRYDTGIGPIRLDVAAPVARQDGRGRAGLYRHRAGVLMREAFLPALVLPCRWPRWRRSDDATGS
jgi:translocation and assembly module TamA